MNTPILILGTQTTPVELIAVVFGLLSVWYMKKESILAYPFGIINVAIYVYICYIAGLYAYSGINVFYAIMSGYGWINWARRGDRDEKLHITSLDTRWIFIYTGLIVFFFILLWFLLTRLTDSTIPGWDALTTSIYIIGMWLLARKKIENWICWIVGDIISVLLFASQNYYFSSFQFFVFTIIAILGFLEWRKKLLQRT